MLPATILKGLQRRSPITTDFTRDIEQPLVKFGFATDNHYGQVDPYGVIVPISGLLKLQDSVTYWNTQNLDFVCLNGDNFESGWIPYTSTELTKAQTLTNIAQLRAVIDTLNCPMYTIFGNHETYRLTKAEVMSAMGGMPSKYYYIDKKGVRFIFLDACYTANADGTDYTSPINQVNLIEFIPPTERAWLISTLSSSPYPVVVFCHQLLSGISKAGVLDGALNVNNAAAIRTILETSGKVLAVFDGHEHDDYKTVVNYIPYFSMQAQGRDPYPANAYAVVEVFSDRVKVNGKGSQISY